MSEVKIEHINLTVEDPKATAAMLVDLFDWRIRWQGEGIYNGLTVHVGGDSTYIALYNNSEQKSGVNDPHYHAMGFNHLGIVVDDLERVEKRVKDAGFKTYNHGDYEPGRRFYFDDGKGFEIEVVSYA